MSSKCLQLFAVLLLTVGACGAAAAADPKADATHYTGRVEPAEQAGIHARVAGTIEKVNVDVGDRVKKGQVLIELAAPELKDDLDAAAARLDQAKAEVGQAEAAVQAAKARLAQAEAALEAARAAVKHVKAGADQVLAEADRLRQLGDAGAVKRGEIDEHLHKADAARAAAEEAEAQVKAAEAARDVAAAEGIRTEAGVKAAQAGVAVAQAGVRRAQTQLGFTRIVAPFDGVVARRLVDAGSVVGPPLQGESAPLLTVMRDDVVHVVFDVDERGAAVVAAGASVVVRVPALKDADFAGKVTRIGAAVNPDTGTLRIEADLPNADGKLRPGMFATVEVKAGEAGK